MARELKETVRENILHAAKERFWRFGIKKTTIDEIAADADVGKGSVYLHFESKEEIAIAILLEYKRTIFEEQEQIASQSDLPVLDRFKKVLILPVVKAHEHCLLSPMVMEMIVAIKPQLGERMRSIREKEIVLLERLIAEANASSVMHVENPKDAARMISLMALNFMPASTTCSLVKDIPNEVARMIDLLYQGLK